MTHIIKKTINYFLPLVLKKYLFLFFPKLFKFDEVRLIFSFFKKKGIRKGLMIDVGSHHGSSMEFFLSENWTVHSFEPDRINFKLLSIKFKDFKNLITNNAAVSNKAGKFNFYRSNQSDGINSLIKFHHSHELSYQVDTITLNSYLKKNKISDINFLKIDVEGNDFNVLKSIDLNKIRPEIILVEFENSKTINIGVTTQDILNLFRKFHYSFIISEWQPISNYGSNHCWKKFHNINEFEFVDQDAWGNIIAVNDLSLCSDLNNFLKQTS